MPVLTREDFLRFKATEMEPVPFLDKWIPVLYPELEGRKGSKEPVLVRKLNKYLTWRQACVRQLAVIFGHVSETTIDKRWGAEFENRPEYVPGSLTMADALYTFGEKLNCLSIFG